MYIQSQGSAALLTASVCSALVGQFVCVVQFRGGNGLQLDSQVSGAGRPVLQRGSLPGCRRSFSEGGTLVPHGPSLSI